LTQGPASDLMYGSTQYPGRVAQLVEQGIENPRVGGSIPSPATTTRFQDIPESPGMPLKARIYAGFLLPVSTISSH
jgi:hypothetical protein